MKCINTVCSFTLLSANSMVSSGGGILPAPDGQSPGYVDRWNSRGTRAFDIPYAITHDGGTTRVIVDQNQNGGQWISLGRFAFGEKNGSDTLVVDPTSNHVVADALLFNFMY